MQFIQLPAFNDNYIWLLEKSGHVWVVDPGDATVVREYLENHSLYLDGFLITHHHRDHIGGVSELVDWAITSGMGSPMIYGPSQEEIPHKTQSFSGGEVIDILNGVLLQVIDVGGHFTAEQVSTPARYLVVGHAITYLLPFLHKDSRFFGLGTLSRQADALIAVALAKPDARPLRILLRQAVAGESLWELLEPFGFEPSNTHLKCFHFRTDIDVYVICEIATKLTGQQTFMEPIALDFRDGEQLLPPSLLNLSGLAAQEIWGRWSDSDQVTIHFANCLPKGKLLIDVRGHAFGPNIGKPVRLLIGSSQATITLGEFDEDVRINLNNQGECEKKLVLLVPEKATPLALGISEDTRTLGLGLVQIGIRAGK